MDVADGHWVLVVVELHLRPLGNMYQFSVYNSNKLSRYMSSLGQLAIEPVLEHLSGILPKSEWKFSRKEVKCAAHEKIEDSGIAVISNAIAILNHSTLEEDMGEVACWTRREKYARHCMESGNCLSILYYSVTYVLSEYKYENSSESRRHFNSNGRKHGELGK